MLTRLLRYADKRFDLSDRLLTLTDSRPRPQIPAAAVWASALAMFLLRARSLNALGAMLRAPGRLERMVGPLKPSDDTVGRVMARMDPAPIGAILQAMVRQLGRDKLLISPWAFRLVAVDGHELFRLAPPLL